LNGSETNVQAASTALKGFRGVLSISVYPNADFRQVTYSVSLYRTVADLFMLGVRDDDLIAFIRDLSLNISLQLEAL
jgi:hypothetical protein